MNWLILTIVSAVTGSLMRILQKILLRDEQSDPYAFGFVFQVMVGILFFLYTLATHSFEIPDLRGLLVNMVVMTIFYSLGNICVFIAFKFAAVSEVSIILASSTIWTVLAAIVLLGERLTLLNVLGILLILGGVVSINYSKTTWKLNKGHIFALVGALLYGIAFTNDVYIIQQYQSIASYMVLAFVLPGIFTLVFHPSSLSHVPHFFKAKVLIKLLICSFFMCFSAISIFTAYKLGGPASIISPISQSSIIITVILSYLLLREREKVGLKIVGAFLGFSGVLLLL